MSAQPLPGLLAHLAPVLDQYGYLAVGGLITLEDFGIPVPGETILIAAAVYAGAGKLSIFAVALVAFAAAVIGDNIGYAIGFFGGRALVLKYGKYVMITSERLDKAEDFFRRYGGVVVAGARFVEGLRQANGIVAGTTRMAWPRFLAFNALGAALWVGVWTSIGYLAGSHITAIYDAVTRYSLYALIALAAAVAALIIRTVVRRRRRARAPAHGGTGATAGLAASDPATLAPAVPGAAESGISAPYDGSWQPVSSPGIVHSWSGMTVLNTEQPSHAAAAARLQAEPIIWLTTVSPAGQPQSTPVWFLWEAEAFLIYGAANGPKIRSIESNPRVCLHLEGNGRGGANVIFEGTARLDLTGPKADAVPEYIAKYRAFIDSFGWTPESFAADYPHVIRVSPTRARIW